MRSYNLKRDIAYYQGKVVAYNEMQNKIEECFVMTDYKNTYLGSLLASVEMSSASAKKLLRELEDLKDKKTK